MCQEPNGGDGPSNQRAVQQVAGLQRDGLMLVGHLARQADRFVGPAAPGQSPAGPASEVDLALLTAPPEEVAGNAASLGNLLKAVDGLGRAAAPATVTTIRLTTDYIYDAPDNASPERKRRVRDLRRCLRNIRVLLLSAMLLAVGLLMHLDDGRRATSQLAAVRTDLERIFGEIAKTDMATDWVAGDPGAAPSSGPPGAKAVMVADPPALPAAPGPPDRKAAGRLPDYCEPDPPLAAAKDPTSKAAAASQAAAHAYLLPAKPGSQSLCSQLFQTRLREALVFTRLAAWNCRMALMQPVAGATALVNLVRGDPTNVCLQPPAALPAPAQPDNWERTELRTTNDIAMLAGYVLPLLLGCIGGCVYVLRRTDDKLKTWTLSANDGKAGLVRVTLAACFGGLLGLVFGTDAPVQLGGFSLSLAAWAFFLGYSLETVLKALDALIDSVVGKLRPAQGEAKGVSLSATG